MLTTLLITTPNGAMWADARACGTWMAADGTALPFMAKRPFALVLGRSNGTHVSNGATELRPEGLGGSTG